MTLDREERTREEREAAWEVKYEEYCKEWDAKKEAKDTGFDAKMEQYQ